MNESFSEVKHTGIYLANSSNRKALIEAIINQSTPIEELQLRHLNGVLYSALTIEKMLDDEFRHDRVVISTSENASFSTMSSGQQRKALLAWQLAQEPDYIILDDVYSNVDKTTQEEIRNLLTVYAPEVLMIQLFSRKRDMLPFVDTVLVVDDKNRLVSCVTAVDFLSQNSKEFYFKFSLPTGFNAAHPASDPLIELRHVSVKYGEKQVLSDVNWSVGKGEFWQLAGPNGSGKSTLVSMICGDNPKAYGQDMQLFGMKKGSGESIWDIKKHIGYFTPQMMLRFTRNDSVENMILSGLNDSVGLYVAPTDLQQDLARHWTEMLGPAFINKKFQQLSTGQQRMVMVARAMIKHPPLLMLDEPTIELDDQNSRLFISMVNAIAAEKKIAIIYVSHRDEEDLKPEKVFELVKAEKGFTGIT